jgi:hypothetical protein
LNKVTERLIDLNILRWYPRLREYKLNVPIFLFILAIEALVFSRSEKFTASLRAQHIHGWRPYPGLALCQFLMYLVMVNFLTRIRRAWLFCVCTLLPGALAIPALFLALLLFVEFAGMVAGIQRTDPQSIISNADAIVAAFWVGVYLIVAVGLWFWLAVVLSGIGLMVSAAHLVVNVLRGLLWRIVTHAKGAWTAVWLLITGILSVLEVAVHFKNG